jgi:hypothetical protein
MVAYYKSTLIIRWRSKAGEAGKIVIAWLPGIRVSKSKKCFDQAQHKSTQKEACPEPVEWVDFSDRDSNSPALFIYRIPAFATINYINPVQLIVHCGGPNAC